MSDDRAASDDADWLASRRERIGSYLEATGYRAVWFARPNGFAWLTGGSNVVDRDSPIGVAAAGYTDEGGFVVLTDNIEADRLEDEELPAAFDIEVAPWYETSIPSAIESHSPTPAVADVDVASEGFDRIDGTELRTPLSQSDCESYESLAMEAALAVETICRELEPGDIEQEVAAGLRIALSTRGIEAPVVLVGGGDRATEYRHYTPSDRSIDDYALVSVTVQRGGLYVSLTRTVAFDPPEWLDRRHEAAATVETSALSATREAAQNGDTAGDVFEAIVDAYDAVGHPDEWQRHHQGGAAGFSGREWIATPTSEQPVVDPMAYAWNPTVQGAKSEGTVLLADGALRPLSATGRWPTIEVESVDGTTTIERPAILEH